MRLPPLALCLVLLATGCASTRVSAYRAGYEAGYAAAAHDAVEALPPCQVPPLPGTGKRFPGDPLPRSISL